MRVFYTPFTGSVLILLAVLLLLALYALPFRVLGTMARRKSAALAAKLSAGLAAEHAADALALAGAQAEDPDFRRWKTQVFDKWRPPAAQTEPDLSRWPAPASSSVSAEDPDHAYRRGAARSSADRLAQATRPPPLSIINEPHNRRTIDTANGDQLTVTRAFGGRDGVNTYLLTTPLGRFAFDASADCATLCGQEVREVTLHGASFTPPGETYGKSFIGGEPVLHRLQEFLNVYQDNFGDRFGVYPVVFKDRRFAENPTLDQLLKGGDL